MTIEQKLTPLTVNGLSCRPDRTMVPTSLTIHNTGNPNANALQHANAQSRGELASMQMAVHYYVDDTDTAWQCLEDTQQGWHAGDGSNPKGGNYTSIAIEICEQKGIDQVRAFQNAAALCAVLLTRHGLTTAQVKQHHDWTSSKYPTGKDCPYLLRHATVGVNWNDFLGMIQAALTPAPPAELTPLYTAKTTDMLNIRTGPSASYPVRGVLARGVTVSLLSEIQNGWYAMDDQGTVGYIYGSFLTDITPVSTLWYRVQVGAFAVKANADAFLETVKAAGFTDAYITASY